MLVNLPNCNMCYVHGNSEKGEEKGYINHIPQEQIDSGEAFISVPTPDGFEWPEDIADNQKKMPVCKFHRDYFKRIFRVAFKALLLEFTDEQQEEIGNPWKPKPVVQEQTGDGQEGTENGEGVEGSESPDQGEGTDDDDEDIPGLSPAKGDANELLANLAGKISGKPVTRAGKKKDDKPYTNAEVKAWCMEKGIPVNDRGRIPAATIARYELEKGYV